MSQDHNSSDVKVAILEHFSNLQNSWEFIPTTEETENTADSSTGKAWKHVENLIKNPFGAAQDSPLAKAYPVGVALVISGALLWGLCTLSAGGDISVLQQRLVGQVQLSTGNHWARSVDELNQLSWDNGLDLMEALDHANTTLTKVESMVLAGKTGTPAYARGQASLKQQFHHIEQLIQDRHKLEDVQKVFHAKELYAPVFHEYLSQTQDRFYTLNHPPASTEQASLE